MPRVKAVLDTNVIVSALLKEAGREALILDLALQGRFTPVLSGILLEEYEEVLRRPRFAFNPTRVSQAIHAIRNRAVCVEPRKQVHVARDPDDNMVLAAALAGGADFVVTGNTRHFPKKFQGIRIIPPRQFVVILAAEIE